MLDNLDKFEVLPKVTERFNLPVIRIHGTIYIDVTPLVVDCGAKYEGADEFRINSGLTIRDLKNKL